MLLLLRRTSLAAALASLIALPSACTEDAVSKDLASLSDLEHGCVVSAACGIQARARVSDCIDYYYRVLVGLGLGPIYRDIYSCVRAAGADCSAVERCFGQTGSCTNATFKGYCAGNTAYTCDLLDGKVYTLECSTSGLTCAPKQSEQFAAECHCDKDYKVCHGGFAITCPNEQPETRDCAALGGSCVDGACSVPTKPKACDMNMRPYCEGSVVVHCRENGELERDDCSKHPIYKRCKNGACFRSGDECDIQQDDFNRCTPSGDLEACIDGKWKTFKCAEMGLGDCREAFYGANCARYN